MCWPGSCVHWARTPGLPADPEELAAMYRSQLSGRRALDVRDAVPFSVALPLLPDPVLVSGLLGLPAIGMI